jgi:hypothetical protein
VHNAVEETRSLVSAASLNSKSSVTIYPHSSGLVAKLLGNFDTVVTDCMDDTKIQLTDDDRRKLGHSAMQSAICGKPPADAKGLDHIRAAEAGGLLRCRIRVKPNIAREPYG